MRLLSAIKKDLEFNMNLYNLLEVLKEIAIAQYKILEKKLKVFETVFPALGAIYDMLGISNVDHPLMRLERPCWPSRWAALPRMRGFWAA